MVFTSVAGHITEKAFPPQNKKWDLETSIDLYDAEIITYNMDRCEAIIRTIKIEAQQARMLIIWTDCDREGENIGYEIIQAALSVNINLVVKRAVFSALTRQDIFRAINNLQQPNKNLSDAVEVRQNIDLTIGSSFTRLQTLLFRDLFFPNLSFEERKKHIISYGPCLFPTLYFIVVRAEQRRQFKKEDFWYLEVEVEKKANEKDRLLLNPNCNDTNKNNINFDDDNAEEDEDIAEDQDEQQAIGRKKGKNNNKKNKNQNNKKNNNNKNTNNINSFKIIFNWEKDERILNYQIIREKYLSLRGESHARVFDTITREAKKYRPVPLNTVEFTKLVARKLRINSHKAMEVAEKLYTKGFISYPRTETQIFASDFDFLKFLNEQTNSDQWGEFVENLINEKQNSQNKNFYARQGKSDDKSHPPIYPVKFPEDMSIWTSEEKLIYELISRHFIANVCEDAQGEETTIKLKIKNEIFKKTGTVVKKLGYLEVYKYENWSNNVLPEFAKDELFPLARRDVSEFDKRCFLYVEMGTTSPPEFLREADLIGLMDENGIGTDATISEHIKNVQEKYLFFLLFY
jgi:DNA topoisomerase-3